MNALKSALIVILFSSTTAMAVPASDESIKQLFAVTQTQKLLDSVRGQIDTLMNNAIQQALQGKTPTAKQQQAITNMKNKMLAVVQGELAWEKLEPLYLRLYKETLTEEEVTALVSFYRTPLGQTMINKMPILMQKTMMETQKMVSGAAPKMQKIQQDFLAEMNAASK